MLPDYEVPEGPGQPEGGGVLERLGRYAQEHGVIRANELYEDDRDNWGG